MQKEKQPENVSVKFVPPKLLHVKIYFIQKGMSEKDAEDFFLFRKKTKWKTKRGKPISDWKTAANECIWDCKQSRRQKDVARLVFFFNRNDRQNIRQQPQTYLSRFS